tara:strand:- start:683 stop:886 length:204 start_codon:yes stop_codon:yes gene_type:complete
MTTYKYLLARFPHSHFYIDDSLITTTNTGIDPDSNPPALAFKIRSSVMANDPGGSWEIDWIRIWKLE